MKNMAPQMEIEKLKFEDISSQALKATKVGYTLTEQNSFKAMNKATEIFNKVILE